MAVLQGPLEGDAGGGVELEVVALLTGLYSSSHRGTLGASGHDGPCLGNCCVLNISD
jgi:hypothetical protein